MGLVVALMLVKVNTDLSCLSTCLFVSQSSSSLSQLLCCLLVQTSLTPPLYLPSSSR